MRSGDINIDGRPVVLTVGAESVGAPQKRRVVDVFLIDAGAAGLVVVQGIIFGHLAVDRLVVLGLLALTLLAPRLVERRPSSYAIGRSVECAGSAITCCLWPIRCGHEGVLRPSDAFSGIFAPPWTVLVVRVWRDYCERVRDNESSLVSADHDWINGARRGVNSSRVACVGCRLSITRAVRCDIWPR